MNRNGSIVKSTNYSNGTPTSMNGHRRRRGFRRPRTNLTPELLLALLGGGQRLEILRLLVANPMSVGKLATALYIPENSVSRDLALLDECGFVRWSRDKSLHVYQITERVRGIRNGDMLQIMIVSDIGHWVIVHLDESADPTQMITPPSHFVRGHEHTKDSSSTEICGS